jgi:membrane protein involved in colicin uptake
MLRTDTRNNWLPLSDRILWDELNVIIAESAQYEETRTEVDAMLKAEREARTRTVDVERLVTRSKVREEAVRRAQEEATARVEVECRLKAEEEARLNAQREARIRTEEVERLVAELKAREKAEAKVWAEVEARLAEETKAREGSRAAGGRVDGKRRSGN